MSNGAANEKTTAIVTAFTEADYDRVPALVKEGVDAGVPAQTLLDEALVVGIREVGEMFRRGDAFLPEMMLGAEAWQAGMDVLEPLLEGQASSKAAGKVVIGTVKGDIHSLGKNIVSTMLKTAGFDVVDLGIDVPASKFVTAAVDGRADVIALCALMTTTSPQQREVIEHLNAAGRRGDFYVMVGGSAATAEWATEIGADGYGATAADAVSMAEDYVGNSRRS